jgi:hypothetical protein
MTPHFGPHKIIKLIISEAQVIAAIERSKNLPSFFRDCVARMCFGARLADQDILANDHHKIDFRLTRTCTLGLTEIASIGAAPIDLANGDAPPLRGHIFKAPLSPPLLVFYGVTVRAGCRSVNGSLPPVEHGWRMAGM